MKTMSMGLAQSLALTCALLVGCGSDTSTSSGAESSGSAGSSGTETTSTGASGSGGSGFQAGSGGATATGTGGAAGTGTAGASAGGRDGGGQAGSTGAGTDGGASNDPQAPGTWRNVTPPEIDAGLRAEKSWGGCQFVFADPVRKSDIYSACDSLGFWRSTDYGLTWTKTNTGMNGNKIVGRTWSGAIDQNPKRDPATFPAIYVTLGYGTSSIWKSTNGGVDWTNVWNNNVFKEDGVTNIFSDVGSDINGLYATDATNADHLICYLHGYFGKGGNSGVFETTDGGGKWIVHGTGYFNFQAHSDVAFPINSSTWEVSHGTTYPNSELWRTTDAGKTWGIITNNFWIGGWNGAQNLRVGSVIYGEGKPLAKSTDDGATWTRIASAGPAGTSCLTETGYIYVTPGDQDQGAMAFNLKRAKKDNDAVWTDVAGPDPQSMFHGAGSDIGSLSSYRMVATYDGTHAIIVSNNMMAGIWRYVEP
jgi:hypothetical protein